jgi:hypothetical protein
MISNYSCAVPAAAEPLSVVANVRRGILSEDPNLPITAACPLTEFIEERIVQDRPLARLSMVSGAMALLLAVISLYGMVS